MTEAAVGNLRKRRTGAKASITHIGSKVTDLEADATAFNKGNNAKLLWTKLNEVSFTYEQCHWSIVDTINPEQEEALQAEQDILDRQMDIVQDLAVRLQTLIDDVCVPATDERKITSRRINCLHCCLSSLSDTIRDTPTPDVPHLKHYEQQLLGYKGELAVVNDKLFSLDLEDTDELVAQHTTLEGIVFAESLRLKELIAAATTTPAATRTDLKCSKLPKLDVPTFDGDLLNWRSF